MSRVIGKPRPGVQGPPDHHRRCPRGSLAGPGRPGLRRLRRLGFQVGDPLPRGGRGGVEARSRRPVTRPATTEPIAVDLVVRLRQELTAAGLDAGADTIVWHLEHHHQVRLSRATVYRILRRHTLIVAEPKKKPKSSYIRFQAEQPNETWQADFTHHRLADGTDIEILTWLDDHSRYALSVTAHRPVTGPAVVHAFTTAVAQHGIPFSTLTDNGLVFTTRFAHGGRTSRNRLETELVKLRVRQKNSRPNHPTTCGKVERFQQTIKAWLRVQPAPATITELQAQLDQFVNIYNHHRPHRSLPHRSTPATAYTARPKAAPGQDQPDAAFRVRHDRVDNEGSITLRHNGRLHHIGVGRPLARTPVVMLSTTSKSESSTPPPAKSSATSPSTPTATTNPPASQSADPDAPTDPEKAKDPNPNEGSDPFRCLATSSSGGGRI
jgi:transposase InsO family protein